MDNNSLLIEKLCSVLTIEKIFAIKLKL